MAECLKELTFYSESRAAGKGGHFAIERQHRRAPVGVIEGDESVGQAGLLGFAQRVEHRVAIGGLDQTAGQRRKDRRTGVGLCDPHRPHRRMQTRRCDQYFNWNGADEIQWLADR